MKASKFLVALMALFLVGCGTGGGLSTLLLDANDLHDSLVARHVEDMPLHVPHELLRSNPQHSTEREFVEAVSRGGTQGRIRNTEEIKAALYAVYRGESDIGIYGLEAESVDDADLLEAYLREVWTVNVSFDRARVHRGGRLLAVVWSHPETPACWDAVNSVVADRLNR